MEKVSRVVFPLPEDTSVVRLSDLFSDLQMIVSVLKTTETETESEVEPGWNLRLNEGQGVIVCPPELATLALKLVSELPYELAAVIEE